jgi:hypothetical protein
MAKQTTQYLFVFFLHENSVVAWTKKLLEEALLYGAPDFLATVPSLCESSKHLRRSRLCAGNVRAICLHLNRTHVLPCLRRQSAWPHLLTLLTYFGSTYGSNCAPTQGLPSIICNPNVHYRVHKNPPLVPILSQIDPVHTIPSYLSKIYFNTVHRPTSWSSSETKFHITGSKSHVHFLALRSFIQRTHPGPRLLMNFRNKLIFYGEELLARRPTSKLEDHPLLAVRDCLFNVFAATLHIRWPSPPSATWGRAMSWWQGNHLTWHLWGC